MNTGVITLIDDNDLKVLAVLEVLPTNTLSEEEIRETIREARQGDSWMTSDIIDALGPDFREVETTNIYI